MHVHDFSFFIHILPWLSISGLSWLCSYINIFQWDSLCIISVFHLYMYITPIIDDLCIVPRSSWLHYCDAIWIKISVYLCRNFIYLTWPCLSHNLMWIYTMKSCIVDLSISCLYGLYLGLLMLPDFSSCVLISFRFFMALVWSPFSSIICACLSFWYCSWLLSHV